MIDSAEETPLREEYHMFKMLTLSITLLAMVHLPLPAADQDETKKAAPAKVKAPRALTIADTEKWERIAGFKISPDTNWVGYFQRPNEGDGIIWIKQREGEKAYKYTVGPGSGGIEFSHDSTHHVVLC